jgi:hypothetical protein
MEAQNTILVVGNASTAQALMDLTYFASDVADRLQVPATVAVGRNYDVTQYAGVVIAVDYLDSVDSAVLATEAFDAEMFVIDADTLYGYPIDDVCGHCGEKGAAPVLVDRTWTTSVCEPCADSARRHGGLKTLVAA